MARTVGDAMCVGWEVNDYVGVDTLETILGEMAGASRPLIEKKGDGPMHKCEVRLTPIGESKLHLIGS
ncbi:MAG: hypothetical protein Pars93KO_27140 [Parasphingorhabdus sp.]